MSGKKGLTKEEVYKWKMIGVSKCGNCNEPNCETRWIDSNEVVRYSLMDCRPELLKTAPKVIKELLGVE